MSVTYWSQSCSHWTRTAFWLNWSSLESVLGKFYEASDLFEGRIRFPVAFYANKTWAPTGGKGGPLNGGLRHFCDLNGDRVCEMKLKDGNVESTCRLIDCMRLHWRTMRALVEPVKTVYRSTLVLEVRLQYPKLL